MLAAFSASKYLSTLLCLLLLIPQHSDVFSVSSVSKHRSSLMCLLLLPLVNTAAVCCVYCSLITSARTAAVKYIYERL